MDFVAVYTLFKYIIMKHLFFFLLCFCSLTGLAQLSADEKQLLDIVGKNMPYSWKLLKESVNINSGTFNIAGVKKVGALYKKELEALGFTVEWVKLPDSLKRAGHLVASKKGTKGKKLFLIGHLDTVFEPYMPANAFKQISDSLATGQGVNDMKGGDVIIISALKALHQQGLLRDASITVYMTGDEENAGYPKEISRGDFIKRAQHHEIALAFETATSLNIVATARRGASSWQVEVDGKQGHSSGVFGAGGYGAIYEAARIINSFRERLGKQEFLTFNPGLFIGGSEVNYNKPAQKGEVSGKTNIISPKTVIIGDLRFLTEGQKDSARETMREIVSQNLAGTKASISFEDGIPSMPPTSGNVALVKVVSAISERMGLGPVQAGNPGSRGAGDISYVAKYLDCLDGLGASGKGAHAPGETINTKKYPLLIGRTALLLFQLTR